MSGSRTYWQRGQHYGSLNSQTSSNYPYIVPSPSGPPGNPPHNGDPDETASLVNGNQVRKHNKARIAQIGIPVVFVIVLTVLFTMTSVLSAAVKRDMTEWQHVHDEMMRDITHLREQKGVLSDDLQHLREAKSAVSNDLQHLREAKSAVSDDLQHLRDTKSAVSDDLQHLRETKNTVSKDLQRLRETRSAVSDDIQQLRIQRQEERREWERERDKERRERERERDKERRERKLERGKERREREREREEERREWKRECEENEQRRHGYMPFWGETRMLTEECPEDRIRQYDAPMHNLLVEDDWYAACMNTAIDIAGRRLASPRTCTNYGLVDGVRGYWSIEVNSSEC